MFYSLFSSCHCDTFDELSLEELLPVMIEAGEMNFKCIELLDNAIQEKSTTSILLEESHPAENGNVYIGTAVINSGLTVIVWRFWRYAILHFFI